MGTSDYSRGVTGGVYTTRWYWAVVQQWLNRLRVSNKRAYHVPVDNPVNTDRLVIISAQALDDLLELARMAAERLPQEDALHNALVGSISQVRTSATIEP